MPANGSYKTNDLQNSSFLRSSKAHAQVSGSSTEKPDEFHQLYVHEILAGKEEIGFKGIYPLIEELMAVKCYNKEDVEQVRMNLTFLMERAVGKVQTDARFIRDFVLNHPEYRHDSIVNSKINYDLMSSIVNMSKDAEERAKLLGKKWQTQ